MNSRPVIGEPNIRPREELEGEIEEMWFTALAMVLETGAPMMTLDDETKDVEYVAVTVADPDEGSKDSAMLVMKIGDERWIVGRALMPPKLAEHLSVLNPHAVMAMLDQLTYRLDAEGPRYPGDEE